MIFEKMKALIADQFGIDAQEVTMDTSFSDDLNADSIDLVELMMAAEEEFGIGEVDENALEKVRTVADVVNYIQKSTE